MLLLFILLLPAIATSNQCMRSSAVSFSVSSYKNQTGHQQVEASVRSDVSENDSIVLQVEQWTEQCGNRSSLGLTVQTLGGHSEKKTKISEVKPLPGYTYLPGFGYYKVLGKEMRWAEGRQACEAEGTRLALVKNQEEIDALFSNTPCCGWIGVFRAIRSSPWMNVLGNPMKSTDFFGWLPGYPVDSDNNCLILNASTRRGTTNEPCSASQHVICEQSM